jgi:hypothetical protein
MMVSAMLREGIGAKRARQPATPRIYFTVTGSGHAFAGLRSWPRAAKAYRPGSYRQTAQARLRATWPSASSPWCRRF